MLYKRPGSKYYWCKFQWRGQTIRKSTGAMTKKAAHPIEAKIRTELAQGNFGILKPKVVPSLKQFLNDEFLPYTEGRFKESPKTLDYYTLGVKMLDESHLAKLRLDEINSQHAMSFATKLRRYSASTVNRGLRTLRRALRLAEEWERINRAPKIELAKGEIQRERHITEFEFSEYLMACRQPWRDAALVIYCLGFRPGEVFTLRWENISLTDEGFIQVTKGKSKAARRTLPMVPLVRRALESRFRSQGCPKKGWMYPTLSRSGHLEKGTTKNQHIRAIHAVNKAAAEEAKKKGILNPEQRLKPFPPYCLRHTALTNLAPECDTFALRTIAGHSSIAMTQRYVHPQGRVISDAFKKLADRQKVGTDGGHSNQNSNPEVAAQSSIRN